MKPSAYIQHFALSCSLGNDKSEVIRKLLSGDGSGLACSEPLISGRTTMVGRLPVRLPAVPDSLARFDCRNARLLLDTYSQISEAVEQYKILYAGDRIGVVLGSSTAGIAEGERAIASNLQSGTLPIDYDYLQQELGSVSEFISTIAGLRGPAYTVSTACSSSARAVISAIRLLEAGICDAVIAGGADTLCGLTLNGFDSLEALSESRCNPFSHNRDGINIGEGAALFLITREPGPLQILGFGESSDGYHISAPDPSGSGPELAIREALKMAGLLPGDVGYINVHGTGTGRNDSMEANVLSRIFGTAVPCGSTKPLTGHTLGAAGALELAFCCLILDKLNHDQLLPPHVWDAQEDPQLASIALVIRGQRLGKPVCMSNNFAFGGSNASLIVGRSADGP
ncbi:MAG: beta-ketoacyl-[acyl-carrier-protein] synthase family protein [Gammaproteobacteria bacterium]|nr:beta-ketoacyl-[acyl-carrier-protein] synthase family protein [Gammaproteobacteria bacterium]